MDDHAPVARDDADGLDGLAPALGVEAFEGDVAGGVDVYPVVLGVDAQRGLVGVDGGHGEQALDGAVLPLVECVMELGEEPQQRGLGQGAPDEGVYGLCDALERDHLGGEQVHDIGFEAVAVLDGGAHVGGEGGAGVGVAARAVLALGVEGGEGLLEDDVDTGATLGGVAFDVAQVLAAARAVLDGDALDVLDGAGVGGARVVVSGSLALGGGAGERGVLVGGLGGGEAGAGVALRGRLLHEHGHEQLEQPQQGLEQGAGVRIHLALGAQRLELRLEGVELLAQRVSVERGHDGSVLDLDRHHRAEHREALGMRQRRVAPGPVLGLALDALAVGEVASCVARPVQPLGGEVEPQLLGAHPALVHHLPLDAAPARKALVVQRRRVARDHHLTRQRIEQRKQRDVVRLLVVEPIPPARGAGALQIRRVAVDELGAFELELGQIPVGTAVHELDGVVALERIERAHIEVDADVAQRRRLAPHDGAPTEMGLDVGVVRRHHRNQGLTQPRGRLRPEVAHPRGSRRRYGSRTLATRRYDVKPTTQGPERLTEGATPAMRSISCRQTDATICPFRSPSAAHSPAQSLSSCKGSY